jgi:transcriptional regulator with PAS, ATPase and Fis domain
VIQAPHPLDDRRPAQGAPAPIEWGLSRVMESVSISIDRVAATPRTTVLITGESGVGKEVVAREIHRRSSRRAKPFLAVNCAGLADGLLEADLFGYAPGAFTGALPRGREGLLAAAEGGSILFDEIGELDLALQAKLLRVLQERAYRPVGEAHDRPMDVRILAATNRDLGAMVAQGKFREDLYYRLNVLSIRVPALRDRIEDVPLLAERLAGEISREHGVEARGFSAEALSVMLAHRWPGNVRELRNSIERAVTMAGGGTIDAEHFAFEGAPRANQAATAGGLHLPVEDRKLESVERALIERVLHETAGNRSQAARLLGVNRTTLYNKLRVYGISA